MEATWSSIRELRAELVVMDPIRFRALETKEPGDVSGPISSVVPDLVLALLRLLSIVFSSSFDTEPE